MSRKLVRELRHRVVGLLHAGRLQPGDRLPSIRQMAREMDADHRAVAAAYRRLEQDGVVEIRPGSGVYVAAADAVREDRESEAGWLAGVFTEAWERQVRRADLGSLMHHCATSRLRCACIESVEDHLVAMVAELEEDFDILIDPINIARLDPDEVDDIAGRADFLVSLHFHATEMRALASRFDLPCVVITFNTELTSSITCMLNAGPVKAVVLDPAMASRAKDYFAVTPFASRIEMVLAEELSSLEDAAQPGVALLATRAARRTLGAEDYHLLPPPARIVDTTSARELYELIIRLSLQSAPLS